MLNENKEPYLIELNARFAGDVPRATHINGYDQLDLFIWSLVDLERFYSCN